MIDLRVSEAPGNFFDRPRVTAATDRARVRALSRLGAFIRTRAVSSMLGHAARRGFGAKSKVSNRDGISAPGSPPSPHSGELVKLIFFVFDSATKSVVVGPVALNKPTRHPGYSGTVPELLEAGGDVLTSLRKGAVRQHYRARPYMKPAMDAEIANAPSLWANSVRT